MRFSLLAAVLLVATSAASEAKPRAKKAAAKAAKGAKAGGGAACGAKFLPLREGNQWTYNPIPAPLPAPDAVKRLAPAQPKSIVITVKKVEANKDGVTVATLEEKFLIDRTREEKKPLIEERAITTTIECTDKRFDISPDSFFFAGEPGGYVGLEITKLERIKGSTSLAFVKGGIGEAEWRDDMILQWAQKPHEHSGAKLASGKLELERRFTPQPTEKVLTKMGPFDAEKLGLITTGRVTLENAAPTMKPQELPANWVSQLWLSEGQGMVQALNSYGQMYQLVDSQLSE